MKSGPRDERQEQEQEQEQNGLGDGGEKEQSYQKGLKSQVKKVAKCRLVTLEFYVKFLHFLKTGHKKLQVSKSKNSKMSKERKMIQKLHNFRVWPL